MMNRTVLWAATVLFLTMSARLAPGQGAAKPNFLFVYTDDQRWDAMSCVQQEQGDKGRFPWFQTPNMDRLAREGVRFRNAFVINSLCAPSRSNFLNSQYSHLNGVANNHTPMPLDTVNHATVLRKNGYVTGYFGKFHHGQQPERPGFDVIASFIGQGKYVDCPMNVNGKMTPTKGWVDDVTTDYAIQFIKDHANQPFDMVVGFKSCHGPRTPPERAANRFEGETMRPVPNLDVVPPYKAAAPPAKKAGANQPAGRARQLAQLSYFRTISAADDCLGRLLDTLDDLKLADNTIVIFASDNGYYFGEHTLGDKRSAYDESMRIPLIVRFPKSVPAGRVVDQMVLNIDLAPTLLDYAGVAIPLTMQGRSWRPLLEGKPVLDWRTAFFYEYFFERGYPGIPTVTAVRTDTAKLIKYPGHDEWTELFDLQKDPYEMKNLYNDANSAALRHETESCYTAESKSVNFKIPDYADKPPK
jgi:arylsulfatase A-like enzyme